MPGSAIDTITKLVGEKVFIRCDALRDPLTGVQMATIQEVEWIRLAKRTIDGNGNPAWEVAVSEAGYSFVQPVDDDEGGLSLGIIAAILDADRDAVPAPGDGYEHVAKCAIAFTAAYGAGTGKKLFRRPARIAYGSVTAPRT